MSDIKEIEPSVTTPPERDTEIVVKPKKPSMWHVLLLNDDYTPMDFVVAILVRFFNKSPDEATQVMLDVHKKGKGIAGTYTYEVAEMKVGQVLLAARMQEFPLLAVAERAD